MPEKSFFNDDEDWRDLEGVVVRVQRVAQPTAGQAVSVDSVVQLKRNLIKLYIILKQIKQIKLKKTV